ncbi:MAG: glycosyltransferase family 2 protein [Tepidisphaeraceae bacterium]
MSAPSPQISVLMPVGAERSYLAMAARSVLEQSLGDLELMVIDDADGFDECARLTGAAADSRVRVISNRTGPGLANALNVALENCRGKIVCLCDADDLYPADRLARQARFLGEHPEYGAMAGGMETLTPKGTSIAWLHGEASDGEITAELRNAITRTSLCTYATRRETFLANAPFRNFFVTSPDIDFQLRLGERCRVWFDPAIVYRWRLHDTSMTHTQTNNRRAFYEATAKEFQKQRRARGYDDLEKGNPPTPPAGDSAGSALETRQQTQQMLMGASWREHRAGRKQKAIDLGFRAALARPTSLGAWKSVALLVLKRAGKQDAAVK